MSGEFSPSEYSLQKSYETQEERNTTSVRYSFHEGPNPVIFQTAEKNRLTNVPESRGVPNVTGRKKHARHGSEDVFRPGKLSRTEMFQSRNSTANSCTDEHGCVSK